MNYLDDHQEAVTDAVENDVTAAPLREKKEMPVCRASRDLGHPPLSPSTPTQRRCIFDSFWSSRNTSSNSWKEEAIKEDEDDTSTDTQKEVKRSTKLEPSYLGVYNFSPTPPAPASRTSSCLSAVSSSRSLAQSSENLPKSILHRHHSKSVSEPSSSKGGSISFAVAPPLPFLEDTSEESRSTVDTELVREKSRTGVHFDPTITVREVIQDDASQTENENESKWFSESELRSFLREAINLCHSSAVHGIRTYSLPALTKAIAAAHKAGVDDPVMSCQSKSEYRSLFSDPILYAADDDIVVHDCSNDFFTVISNEVKNVLIVDNSLTGINLFKRHVLSMFPEAVITAALSGEEALELFGDTHSDSESKSAEVPHYDIIIVEENLQTNSSSEVSMQQSSDCQDGRSKPLSGSDLLSVIGFVERNSRGARTSLKIGISANLADDCEALLRSGADLFWSKPPPRQTNSLRNHMLNSLLSKRGKNIFICGC